MHIGFITPEYQHNNYKGSIGGIGSFTKNLSLELIKKNHRVSIFLYSQNEIKIIEENGIKIHLIKKKKFPFFTFILNRKHVQNYINKSIKTDAIDVLEAPDWTGFTAFMKFTKPLVLRLHGSDTYFCNLENRKLKYKNFFFEKNALQSADKIVGVSSFVAEKTKEYFKLKAKIKVIHNAMNTTLFKPNHKNIIPKTLLYFGTIIRKKGVLEIAPVFNKLVENDSEIKLTFLGRDVVDVFENKSTLTLFNNSLSEEAKKNFIYINSVPYNEVQNHIKQAEVILLPSFAEAFPMTWLEAMALEKKIVTSNIGWAKELMINEETGYTVNPKKHNDFADKTLKLLNEKNAHKMGVNARKRIVNNFNLEHKIEENIKLYQELI